MSFEFVNVNLGRARPEVPSVQQPRATQPGALMLSLLGVGEAEEVEDVVEEAVVVLDVAAAVVVEEVVEDVATTVELVVVEDVAAAPIFWNTFNRLLPPHTSVALPEQAMLLLYQFSPARSCFHSRHTMQKHP